MKKLTFRYDFRSCPPPEELVKFRQDKLPKELDRDITHHLTFCRVCSGKVTVLDPEASEDISEVVQMPEGFMEKLNRIGRERMDVDRLAALAKRIKLTAGGALILDRPLEESEEREVAKESRRLEESADVEESVTFGEALRAVLKSKRAIPEERVLEEIERHITLGTRYRRDGLLDKAIEEFQTAAKAAKQKEEQVKRLLKEVAKESRRLEKSADVRQSVTFGEAVRAVLKPKRIPYVQLFRASRFLGQCLMDKDMPELAVLQYEEALAQTMMTHKISREDALDVRYELGLAHEKAGNRQAALKFFMQVWGYRVNYRDVGEHIRLLKRPPE